MSAIVIIVIVVVALLVLALVAVSIARRAKQTELLRERKASEAAGHRQEADAHAARAQELAPKAEALRREATEHAALAKEEAARAEELDTRATKAEQQKSRNDEVHRSQLARLPRTRKARARDKHSNVMKGLRGFVWVDIPGFPMISG